MTALTITISTKCLSSEADDQLAKLVAQVESNLQIFTAEDVPIEGRIDRYLIAKAPHFIPTPEARVSVHLTVEP